MKAKLVLDITCGATTCASEPGKFCRFLRTQRLGTESVCQLFSEWGYKGRIPLQEKDGWVQRHDACLDCEQIVLDMPGDE